MRPPTPSTRMLRLVTAAATLGALLAFPLAAAATAASPTISVGNSPYGVAVNPSTNTVYVANYADNSVSVINGSTNTVTATVSVGSIPSAVAVNPSTNTVYVANYADKSVSVINGSILPSAPPVNASSASHGSVQISWSPPSIGANISFYCVSVAPRSGSAEVIYVPASQLNTTITGLTNGITYSVTVTAVSSLGAGSPSSPVRLTPRTVPTAPGSPKATAGTKKVTLSWSVPRSNGGSPVTGYRVYIGTKAGHESSTPMNANLVTSLSYIASSLTKGKKYYFVIKAVNAAGMSLGSVEVSATAK